ncbi:hypothetical protein, partial [Streptomyces anulatus]|uniref:hypothetical protein n=1 Tax=Streptomyces anulatus TaxID=1892 RepID=UPI003651478B
QLAAWVSHTGGIRVCWGVKFVVVIAGLGNRLSPSMLRGLVASGLGGLTTGYSLPAAVELLTVLAPDQA